MTDTLEWMHSFRAADAPVTPAPASGDVSHSILTEAARIVQGDRNATHGDKERSFRVIADLWNAYLDGRKNPGPISPRDVAAFMVLLKLARSVQGTAARDHFVDAAGYAGIAGELAEGEPRPAIAAAGAAS